MPLPFNHVILLSLCNALALASNPTSAPVTADPVAFRSAHAPQPTAPPSAMELHQALERYSYPLFATCGSFKASVSGFSSFVSSEKKPFLCAAGYSCTINQDSRVVNCCDGSKCHPLGFHEYPRSGVQQSNKFSSITSCKEVNEVLYDYSVRPLDNVLRCVRETSATSPIFSLSFFDSLSTAYCATYSWVDLDATAYGCAEVPNLPPIPVYGTFMSPTSETPLYPSSSYSYSYSSYPYFSFSSSSYYFSLPAISLGAGSAAAHEDTKFNSIIAGSVIGGAVVLAGSAIVSFFSIRRRRRRARGVDPAAAIPPQGYVPFLPLQTMPPSSPSRYPSQQPVPTSEQPVSSSVEQAGSTQPMPTSTHSSAVEVQYG